MSAYREPGGRPPTPPTVIKYRTYALVARGWTITALISLLGLFILAFLHATHLVCTRSGAQDGVCVVSSYGIAVSERTRVVPLADIVEFVVTRKPSTKGPKTARVELRTASERIELSGGALLENFEHSHALEAQARFVQFQQDAAAPELDLWLHGGVLNYAIMSCFAVGLLALAAAFAREQIRQLQWIRIVVDHEREVVEIGGREVRIEDIKDVGLETGQALSLASGRGEHIVGRRIVVETRRGEHIAATKDFRAGDIDEHRRANATLRMALGPRLEAAQQERAAAKRAKKKRRKRR